MTRTGPRIRRATRTDPLKTSSPDVYWNPGVNPEVLDLIPKGVFSSSIDTYRQLISEGKPIRAYVVDNNRWRDIGTPEAYRAEAFQHLAKKAFSRAFGSRFEKKIQSTRLAGDGSDRGWYRLTAGGRTMIMADHGIRSDGKTLEVDAFIDIGRHLKNQHISVPELAVWDRFSGLAIMEDLGDINLQKMVQNAPDSNHIAAYYEIVIDNWVKLSTRGYEGFNSGWTWQTAAYDRELILAKECRYFVEAFFNGYLKYGR